MVVIAKAAIIDFGEKHPDANAALERWYEEMKNGDWKNFSELKKKFGTADAVGNDRYVFNIKGNQYRLIALIIFKVRTVFILFIGTHKEYDRINASLITYKK